MPLAVPSLSIADTANGGDGTATITGGSGSATNVLKAAKLSGKLGAMSWTDVGTRTGPGSVAFTVSQVGVWLFAVQSTLSGETVWSSIINARISDSADSLHEQLQQAFLDRVVSLSLPRIGSNVRRVKLPETARLNNLPMPSCLLMTFDQQEEFATTGTNGRDDTTFPIHVVLLSKDLTDPTTDAWVTMCRQLIRRSIRSQRLPITQHYTTEFSPGPVVAVAIEGHGTLQGSSMTAKLRCFEPRGV